MAESLRACLSHSFVPRNKTYDKHNRDTPKWIDQLNIFHDEYRQFLHFRYMPRDVHQ